VKGFAFMATRQEILQDLKKTYGGALNIREVGEYLGFCRNKTVGFLKGIPCYDTGKDKKYLSIDLARKIERCERP
jgi:hypothetical protein